MVRCNNFQAVVPVYTDHDGRFTMTAITSDGIYFKGATKTVTPAETLFVLVPLIIALFAMRRLLAN